MTDLQPRAEHLPLCKAVTNKGKPCSREVLGSREGYADQNLDFANYCGIHIWGAPAPVFVTATTNREFSLASSVYLTAVPILLAPRVRATAALEALMICKKFFPWRVARRLA
jgi:hypothetical protein